MLEQTLKLQKPDLVDSEATIFRVFEDESLAGPTGNRGIHWGFFIKSLLKGQIEIAGRHRNVRLVKKVEENNEQYYRNWRLLKRLGIPTVDSMRTSGKWYVLMTDLSAKGAESYGKERFINWKILHSAMYVEMENTLDDIFSQISFDEIIAEVRRIEEIASNNEVLLPGDDPFDLFIYPSGSWEVLVLDLTNLVYQPSGLTHEQLKNENSKRATNFLELIEYMKNNVVAPGLEPGTSRM